MRGPEEGLLCASLWNLPSFSSLHNDSVHDCDWLDEINAASMDQGHPSIHPSDHRRYYTYPSHWTDLIMRQQDREIRLSKKFMHRHDDFDGMHPKRDLMHEEAMAGAPCWRTGMELLLCYRSGSRMGGLCSVTTGGQADPGQHHSSNCSTITTPDIKPSKSLFACTL